jgi:hypothetical protein
MSGVGLLALSYAGGLVATFGAATIFAVGVCYFWPTMLGVVSERIPRSGALGLGLMGTVGMATVGLVTAPQMGKVADRYAHAELPVAETAALFQRAAGTLAGLSDEDAVAAREAVALVVSAYQRDDALPAPETANGLRAIVASDADQGLVSDAQAILGPADNYGGKISFRYVVPLSALLTVIFAALWMRDRASGGYRVERIGLDPGSDGAQPGATG